MRSINDGALGDIEWIEAAEGEEYVTTTLSDIDANLLFYKLFESKNKNQLEEMKEKGAYLLTMTHIDKLTIRTFGEYDFVRTS